MISRDFEVSILDISEDYEKTRNSENFEQKWSKNSKIDPKIGGAIFLLKFNNFLIRFQNYIYFEKR